MQGIIGIENLRVNGFVGIYEKEILSTQNLLIDLKLYILWNENIQSDHIESTVDYDSVVNLCQEVLKAKHYHLIETFAAELLKKILEKFPLRKAWVKVKKPGAIKQADWAYVELEMEKI